MSNFKYVYIEPPGVKLDKIPSDVMELIKTAYPKGRWMMHFVVYDKGDGVYEVQKYSSYLAGVLNLVLSPISLLIHGLASYKQVYQDIRYQLDRDYCREQGAFSSTPVIIK